LSVSPSLITNFSYCFLGSTVQWDNKSQKVLISKGKISISLTIDNPVALVSNDGAVRGVVIAPPELVKDRTVVPLRFISEVLGTEVNYNSPSAGKNGRIDIIPKSVNLPEEPIKITIETSKGAIVAELYPKLMPITVGNFEKLFKSNFYNNLTFHRVEDWVIQGGDPLGNGTGGPDWTIPLEVTPTLKNVRGALAMARSSDPNSADSQFYIAPWLDGQYAVFGKITQGMDIVDKIEIGDKIISVK